jgi:RNA polymerase sigma factor (sigma-70 family)
LYALVNSATRYYLASVLEAQDINDKIHDTFLATLQAIRRRGLEQPDRLRAFIVTIAHRQFAAHVARAVRERRLFSEGTGSEMFRPDPAQNAEQRLIASEKQRIARQALQTLGQRDGELLARFYILEQSPDEIRSAMKLSEAQFRCFKSRACQRLRDRKSHSPRQTKTE